MRPEPTSLPVIFFCLRADSDVDQIVPVMDALAQRGKVTIRPIVYDPLKTYRDDFRLRYLHERHGIAVEHLMELPGVAWHRRLASRAARQLFHGLLGLQRRLPALLDRPARPFLAKLRRWLHDLAGRDEVTRALTSEIEETGRGMVVFDHTVNPLAEAATAAARRRGFPTAALPHSVSHLSNLKRKTALMPNIEGDEGWSALYDRVAIPNATIAERVSQNYRDPSFLTVLGSARFSTDWGKVLDEISPRFDWDPGGKKVLFILSKRGAYVDWPEVDRISRRLSGDPRLAVVFKPHPRTEISGLPDFIAGPGVRMAPAELPTSSLIQWADLVVFWGSSVIYDALRLRKPTLHLAYLFHLNFDFETYLQSWAVKSFDDFEARLERFIATGEPAYSEEEARRCMENLIEQPGAPTLQRYIDFIEDLLLPKQLPAADTPVNGKDRANRTLRSI